MKENSLCFVSKEGRCGSWMIVWGTTRGEIFGDFLRVGRGACCLRLMGTVGVGALVGGGVGGGGGGGFYRLLMVPKLPFAVFSSPAITEQSSKRPLFVQSSRQKAVFCRRIRDFTNKFLPGSKRGQIMSIMTSGD